MNIKRYCNFEDGQGSYVLYTDHTAALDAVKATVKQPTACEEARTVGKAGTNIREAVELMRLREERDQLRRALAAYGDRVRMSFAPPDLQQVIDEAFAKREVKS